ncbi:MAG: undecaprenyl-diphosphatase, partial [Alphaproteobacteria bacterium]
MSWLQLVVLAVVQGITEFLPISSSAHLILVPALTDWPDQGLALDLAVHVGTLGAVLLYYRSDIRAMTVGGMALLRAPLQGTAPEGGARLLMALAVGALPVFIVGGVLVVMGW